MKAPREARELHIVSFELIRVSAELTFDSAELIRERQIVGARASEN